MNNSMSKLELTSIEQIMVLLAVNGVGIVCIGLMGYLINKKAPDPKSKLVISVKTGLVSIILFTVIASDVGIYLWIDSSNFRSATIAIPLSICLGPFMFPVVAAGTYLQLIYRDKIQEYVDSRKR
jgi:hypothetical protein